MDGYRTSAHARFDLRYHFVWIVKYRRRILSAEEDWPEGIDPPHSEDDFDPPFEEG